MLLHFYISLDRGKTAAAAKATSLSTPTGWGFYQYLHLLIGETQFSYAPLSRRSLKVNFYIIYVNMHLYTLA